MNSEKEGSEGNKEDEVHLEEKSQIEGKNDENITKHDDGEEQIQTESSISQSLQEIFINTEKTSEEIEEIKKHVCFNLEPEDMDMDEIQPNGSDFSVQITVGEIVNKLFVVQDNNKKDEEKIDDDYVNFPSSQANADMFFDQMKKKEEETYQVETEDISDPESEHMENIEKTMDLIPAEEKNTKDNNNVENITENKELEEKEGSEENYTNENNENIVNKDTQEDEEGNLSSGQMKDGIHKKDTVKDVVKREDESENEGSENSSNGEDGLIFVKK